MSLFIYKRLHVVIRDPVDNARRHDFLSPIFRDTGREQEHREIIRRLEEQIVAKLHSRPEPGDVLLQETIETSLPEEPPAQPENPS